MVSAVASETSAPIQNAQKYSGSTGIALRTSAGNTSAGGPWGPPRLGAQQQLQRQEPSADQRDNREPAAEPRLQPSALTAPASASHSTGTTSRRVVTRSDTKPGNRNSVSR